jgi:glutamate-ammonia-ligase adenylyltransferase
MLLSGARDVIEARPFVASYADTTAAADEAIKAAVAMTGNVQGFAVLAMGRLGTMEFDCSSDADLLFMRDERVSAGEAARAAEDVVQALSAYTSEGSVMAVDLRLRPHGGEGELVATPAKLDEYFQHDAQPWEALAHTKLRFIAGCGVVAIKALGAAEALRDRFAEGEEFAAHVKEMRAKLEHSEKGMKTSPGAMYDIDFLIGFLLIKHRMHTAEGTMLERLQKLGQVGAIAKPDLQILLDAVEFYHTLEHAIRLVTGRTGKSLPASDAALRSVTELVRRTMIREMKVDIATALQVARQEVRSVYDRIVR